MHMGSNFIQACRTLWGLGNMAITLAWCAVLSFLLILAWDSKPESRVSPESVSPLKPTSDRSSSPTFLVNDWSWYCYTLLFAV